MKVTVMAESEHPPSTLAHFEREVLLRQALRQVQQDVSEDQNVSQDKYTKTARHAQWQHISQIVQQGVSLQHRNLVLEEAVKQSQWECINLLITLGVSPEHRDFALKQALAQSQWECVNHLIILGVSPDLRELALKEAVSQDIWSYIPTMVKVCQESFLTDLALRKAVTECQWNCITQIVKLGVLTKEQREFVCKEAVPWGHFECAVELLRQGISSEHTQWIVFEIFMYGKWQLIVDMLRNGFRLSADGRKLVFGAALTFRQWDAYLQVLESHRASDQDLSEAMSTAINILDHDFLQKLIRCTRNGLRVFKQLCLNDKQQWSYATASILCVNLREQERDLALYIAATQGLWAYAKELYEDDCVSKKSRRFALQRAVHQGAWEHAIEMANKGVTEDSKRRVVFLEAIRQGKWLLALKLLENGLKLKKTEARFATWTCFSLGHLDCVLELCLRLGLNSVGLSAMKLALERTVYTNSEETFKRLLSLCSWRLDTRRCLVKSVCKKIIKLDRANFVRFLSTHYLFCNVWMNEIILLAIKTRWTFFDRIVSDREVRFSCEHFIFAIEKIVNKPKVWGTCIPVLEKLCKRFNKSDIGELLHESEFPACLILAQWCCKRAFPNLSLLLSLESRDWHLVEKILADHAENICKDCLIICFEIAADEEKLDTAVSCLQCFMPEDLDFDDIADTHFSDLRAKCREKGALSWALEFSISLGEWDIVEEDIETCEDQSLIDHVLEEAASAAQGPLAAKLLDRCSHNERVLGSVLESSIQYGDITCAQILISRVNLLRVYGHDRILHNAVDSDDNREEMVRLCISAGLSTLQRSRTEVWFCPMRRALKNGQMPLVRLLHESGSCSNHELHHLREDAAIRAQLENQHRKDILQYLDQAAGNPGSLQHLCRLTVSHLVGYGPGRRDRILSLPLPSFVNDYIMFSDVVSP